MFSRLKQQIKVKRQKLHKKIFEIPSAPVIPSYSLNYKAKGIISYRCKMRFASFPKLNSLGD